MIAPFNSEDAPRRRYVTARSRQTSRYGGQNADPITALSRQLHGATLPLGRRRVRFHPHRRISFTFTWSDLRLVVEVIMHPDQIAPAMDKANAATVMGWRVLLFREQEIRDGSALSMLKKILHPSEEFS